MGIAAGIAPALVATALFSLPFWAAANSTVLAKWRPLEEAHDIIIFGDTDRKFGGQASAYALTRRLAAQEATQREDAAPAEPVTRDDVEEIATANDE